MIDKETQELFLGYLEGELTPAQAAQFEALMAQDPRLEKLVEQVIDDRNLLRSIPQEQAPASIMDSVSSHLERSMLLDHNTATQDHAASRRKIHISKTLTYSGIAAMLFLAVGVALEQSWNQEYIQGSETNLNAIASASDEKAKEEKLNVIASEALASISRYKKLNQKMLEVQDSVTKLDAIPSFSAEKLGDTLASTKNVPTLVKIEDISNTYTLNINTSNITKTENILKGYCMDNAIAMLDQPTNLALGTDLAIANASPSNWSIRNGATPTVLNSSNLAEALSDNHLDGKTRSANLATTNGTIIDRLRNFDRKAGKPKREKSLFFGNAGLAEKSENSDDNTVNGFGSGKSKKQDRLVVDAHKRANEMLKKNRERMSEHLLAMRKNTRRETITPLTVIPPIDKKEITKSKALAKKTKKKNELAKLIKSHRGVAIEDAANKHKKETREQIGYAAANTAAEISQQPKPLSITTKKITLKIMPWQLPMLLAKIQNSNTLPIVLSPEFIQKQEIKNIDQQYKFTPDQTLPVIDFTTNPLVDLELKRSTLLSRGLISPGHMGFTIHPAKTRSIQDAFMIKQDWYSILNAQLGFEIPQNNQDQPIYLNINISQPAK